MEKNIWNLFDFVKGDPESQISLTNSRYYLEISHNKTSWHGLNDTFNQGNYSGGWINLHNVDVSNTSNLQTLTTPLFELSGK